MLKNKTIIHVPLLVTHLAVEISPGHECFPALWASFPVLKFVNSCSPPAPSPKPGY